MPRGSNKPPKQTQFKAGSAWRGNAGGRPKGTSLTALLRKALEQKSPGDKRTNAQVVVDELLKLAREGDRQAIKDIFDRVDGKVPDKLDVSTTTTAADAMAAMSAAGKRYDQRNGKSGPNAPKGTGEVPA